MTTHSSTNAFQCISSKLGDFDSSMASPNAILNYSISDSEATTPKEIELIGSEYNIDHLFIEETFLPYTIQEQNSKHTEIDHTIPEQSEKHRHFNFFKIMDVTKKHSKVVLRYFKNLRKPKSEIPDSGSQIAVDNQYKQTAVCFQVMEIIKNRSKNLINGAYSTICIPPRKTQVHSPEVEVLHNIKVGDQVETKTHPNATGFAVEIVDDIIDTQPIESNTQMTQYESEEYNYDSTKFFVQNGDSIKHTEMGSRNDNDVQTVDTDTLKQRVNVEDRLLHEPQQTSNGEFIQKKSKNPFTE